MTPLTTCSDKKLLRRCSAGDKKAWEELINRFSDIVFRTIQFSLHRYNIAYNLSDLEDFHNTVFLRLFENRCKKLRQYKGINGCSVHSWIKLIAIRTVIDQLRKAGKNLDSRIAGRRVFDELSALSLNEKNPLSSLQVAENSKLLQNALEKLLPRDRLFLKLHFFDEFPLGKVAEILNITENNAYSVKHRALKRLRTEIEQNLDLGK